jgi:hypothetical protein
MSANETSQDERAGDQGTLRKEGLEEKRKKRAVGPSRRTKKKEQKEGTKRRNKKKESFWPCTGALQPTHTHTQSSFQVYDPSEAEEKYLSDRLLAFGKHFCRSDLCTVVMREEGFIVVRVSVFWSAERGGKVGQRGRRRKEEERECSASRLVTLLLTLKLCRLLKPKI